MRILNHNMPLIQIPLITYFRIYLLTNKLTPPSCPIFPSHLLSILLRNSFFICQIPAVTLTQTLDPNPAIEAKSVELSTTS